MVYRAWSSGHTSMLCVSVCFSSFISLLGGVEDFGLHNVAIRVNVAIPRYLARLHLVIVQPDTLCGLLLASIVSCRSAIWTFCLCNSFFSPSGLFHMPCMLSCSMLSVRCAVQVANFPRWCTRSFFEAPTIEFDLSLYLSAMP